MKLTIFSLLLIAACCSLVSPFSTLTLSKDLFVPPGGFAMWWLFGGLRPPSAMRLEGLQRQEGPLPEVPAALQNLRDQVQALLQQTQRWSLQLLISCNSFWSPCFCSSSSARISSSSTSTSGNRQSTFSRSIAARRQLPLLLVERGKIF